MAVSFGLEWGVGTYGFRRGFEAQVFSSVGAIVLVYDMSGRSDCGLEVGRVNESGDEMWVRVKEVSESERRWLLKDENKIKR